MTTMTLMLTSGTLSQDDPIVQPVTQSATQPVTQPFLVPVSQPVAQPIVQPGQGKSSSPIASTCKKEKANQWELQHTCEFLSEMQTPLGLQIACKFPFHRNHFMRRINDPNLHTFLSVFFV